MGAVAAGVQGWVFLHAGRRLAHASGVVVRAGQTLEQEGPLVLGRRGLHASRRAIDALRFARGPTVARVILDGEIVEGAGQVCGSRRRTLWLADASGVIERFLARAVARAARDSSPEALTASPTEASQLVDRARARVLALDDELRDAQWRAGTAQTDGVVGLVRDAGAARARLAALEAGERALREGVLAAHGVCEAASRAIAWNVAREASGAAWDRAYADAWSELAEALESELLALGESAAAERPATSEVIVLHEAHGAVTGEPLRHDVPALARAVHPRERELPSVLRPPVPPAVIAGPVPPPTDPSERPACPDCGSTLAKLEATDTLACAVCGRVGVDGPPRTGLMRAILDPFKRSR